MLSDDEEFKRELDYYLRNYAGRPTPLYFAKNLTEKLGGAKIYLKRGDLLHSGAQDKQHDWPSSACEVLNYVCALFLKI